MSSTKKRLFCVQGCFGEESKANERKIVENGGTKVMIIGTLIKTFPYSLYFFYSICLKVNLNKLKCKDDNLVT